MEIIIDFEKLGKILKGGDIDRLKDIQANKGYIRAIRYNNKTFIEIETSYNAYISKDYVIKYSIGGQVKHG